MTTEKYFPANLFRETQVESLPQVLYSARATFKAREARILVQKQMSLV
jgi:hypothetical protein